MVNRGAGPRDNRRLVLDLDNLGVERGESISDAHTSYSGATLAENLPAALAIYADILRRPHLPPDDLEAVRQIMLQELQAVEDEPSQKLMIELRRRYYPEPWGRPYQGEREAILQTSIDDDPRVLPDSDTTPGEPSWASPAASTGTRLKETVGELLGDWPPGDESTPPEGPTEIAREHLDHDSQQTQIGIAYPSVPYRDDDYFQAWGAVGVLSGGMSARLFTEVRERRGLCYSVYATCHSLRDRAACSATPAPAPSGPRRRST